MQTISFVLIVLFFRVVGSRYCAERIYVAMARVRLVNVTSTMGRLSPRSE